MPDVWASGAAYEPYVGRWSRLVAAEFVDWLDLPGDRRWLDVGCGTGALSSVIAARCEPAEVGGMRLRFWASRDGDPVAGAATDGQVIG